MLIKAKQLIGCKVHATDGFIGEIKTLYFESSQWIVRYFALEGNARRFLIPATLFPMQNFSSSDLSLNLRKDQINNSPDIDLSQPLSRLSESTLASYYNIPSYWGPVTREEEVLQVPSEGTMIISHVTGSDIAVGAAGELLVVEQAANLYSTDEIFGFEAQAIDGDIGPVEDVMIDDYSWEMRYLIVDSARLLPGRKVLLSPQWIDSVNETDRKIRVNVTKNTVKSSPAYSPQRALEPDYELALSEYYEREISAAPYAQWRFDFMRHTMQSGKKLRIEVQAPAVIHWTADNWKTSRDIRTTDTSKWTHAAELPTDNVKPGASVHFTFFWPQANHWEGKNYSVKIVQPAERKEQVLEPAGV